MMYMDLSAQMSANLMSGGNGFNDPRPCDDLSQRMHNSCIGGAGGFKDPCQRFDSSSLSDSMLLNSIRDDDPLPLELPDPTPPLTSTFYEPPKLNLGSSSLLPDDDWDDDHFEFKYRSPRLTSVLDNPFLNDDDY